MSSFKSKLPDMKEIETMVTKLYKDLRASVSEIVNGYKQKRNPGSDEKPHTTETHDEKNEPKNTSETNTESTAAKGSKKK